MISSRVKITRFRTKLARFSIGVYIIKWNNPRNERQWTWWIIVTKMRCSVTSPWHFLYFTWLNVTWFALFLLVRHFRSVHSLGWCARTPWTSRNKSDHDVWRNGHWCRLRWKIRWFVVKLKLSLNYPVKKRMSHTGLFKDSLSRQEYLLGRLSLDLIRLTR